MNGPKKQINDKDMDAIDFSVNKVGGEDIEEKKREFLGGDDDDLKHLGFKDDDDEIDFSNFKIGSKLDAGEEEGPEALSLFGKLAGAFSNYTGNKTMTKADI